MTQKTSLQRWFGAMAAVTLLKVSCGHERK